jgi:hypothetical protein
MDSAGVRIVQNPRTAPDDHGWTVTPAPRVVIGAVDNAPAGHLLSGVYHGIVLEDGSIAIANTDPVEIRVFDPNGAHLRSFGRTGRGPGEFFDRIGQLALLPGDTIAVQNGRLDVHLFALDGSYARSIDGPARSGDFAAATYWLGDNVFLLGRSIREGAQSAQATIFRAPSLYTIWRSPGQPQDTLGVFRGSTQFRGEDPALPSFLVPLGPNTESSWCGETILLGDSRDYSISVFSRAGRLRSIVRKRATELPVSAADRALARQTILDSPLFDPDFPAEVLRAFERLAEGVPIPDAHPAFEEIRCDALGYMWVRTPSHADAPSTSWDVFSPDGILRASVHVPAVARVLSIGADHILAVVEDENDVEFVHRYDLRRQ